MHLETMKVEPENKNQGDYVVINVSDFDPKKHKKYKPAPVKTEKFK